MAFNPFHWFRKHTKIFMAILTIFVVIMFSLSSGISGGGDIFDQIARWFGGGKQRGKDVNELYGDTVTERDVRETTEGREMANNVILASIAESQKNTTGELNKRIEALRKAVDKKPEGMFQQQRRPPTLDGQLLEELEFFLALRYRRFTMGGSAIAQYRAAKDLGEGIPSGNAFNEVVMIGGFDRFPLIGHTQIQQPFRYLQRTPGEMHGDIFRSQARLVALRKRLNQENRPQDVQLIDGLLLQLAIDAWLFDPDRAPGEYALGGSPSTDSALDFMVWKHQADQLNIVITPEDARKEVNRLAGKEFLTGDETKDKEKINKIIGGGDKNQAALDLDKFYEALVEEFRVSIAYTMLLGRGPGIRAYDQIEVSSEKAAVTPGDFYDYFKQQRTEMDLLVVPVSVGSVLSLADQNLKQDELEKAFPREIAAAIVALSPNKKPSDGELKSLFDANRGRIPEPWSPYPAFKQPRLVSIEWIELPDTDGPVDPNYERLATLKGLIPSTDLWITLGSLTEVQHSNKATIQRIRANYPTPRVLEGDPGMAYILSKPPRERIEVEAKFGRQGVDTFGIPVVSHAVESVHLDPNYYLLVKVAAQQILNGVDLSSAPLAMLTTAEAAAVSDSASRLALAKNDRTRRAASVAAMVVDFMGQIGTGVRGPVEIIIPTPVDESTWVPDFVRAPTGPTPTVDYVAIEQEVTKELSRRAALQLFYQHVGDILVELAKERKTPEETDKVLKEKLETYQLKKYYGSTGRALDQFAVTKDPTLKLLHEDYLKSRRGQDAITEDRFASLFFNQYPTYRYPGEAAGLQKYVYWKKQDLPPSEPKSLDDPPQTRELVIQAWRTRKARVIADMIARHIQQELTERAKKDDLPAQVAEARKKAIANFTEIDKKEPSEGDRRLKEIQEKAVKTFYDKAIADLSAKYQPLKFELGTSFALDRVANRFMQDPLLLGRGGYSAWKPPEDKMPYPPADFVNRTLRMGPGDVTVISDLPLENYYLVVELGKKVPSIEDMQMHFQFAKVMNSDRLWAELERSFITIGFGLTSDMNDGMWTDFVEERFKTSRKELIKRLRQEAGKVDAQGRFVLNEGIRKEDRTAPTEDQ